MSGNLLAPWLEQERPRAGQGEGRGRDYRGPDEATRWFQKRTVGSMSGHRDPMRWVRRSVATASSTPDGSVGNRRASSARCSRA